MQIRNEDEKERAAVRELNIAAFGTPAKADLVDRLRRDATPLISLVAVDNEVVVGHIIFSPVLLPGRPDLRIMGLAPMAVAPERQRRGIGAALARAGIKACKKLGFGAIVVLGHPEYYPRFGFLPAVRFGLGCEFEAPEEVFMVLELHPGYLDSAAGTVKYHAAFNRF